MPEDDPLVRIGAPLASVIIAFVFSVLLAAMLAGQVGDTYEKRALVYAGFVLWILLGAAVVFMIAHRGEAGRVSVSRIFLWAASIWLWPLFLLLRRRGSDAN